MSDQLRIDDLLTKMVEDGGSDLHLRVGMRPMARVHGGLHLQNDWPELTDEIMREGLYPLMSEEQKETFEKVKTLDASHQVPGVARFRLNFFHQQGHMGAVFRQIPEKIPALHSLGAPMPLLDFARKPRGLMLVTGPTGSGKSTTLAALIDVINHEREDHILTIEDPIEFVHTPASCVINQREIGSDSPDFALALRAALRQDPDVILVGEMRDNETIETAMTAAETGHLVFGTLHTSSAPSSISRLVDVFPADRQQQILTMLAESLIGVVTQTLLPTADGSGRVAAFEILAMNSGIKANIRAGKIEQLRGMMQTSARDGSQTLDRSLADLVYREIITEEVALSKVQDMTDFTHNLASLRNGKEVAILPLVPDLGLRMEMGNSEPEESSTPPAEAPAPDPASAPPPAASPKPAGSFDSSFDMGGAFDMGAFDTADSEPPEL